MNKKLMKSKIINKSINILLMLVFISHFTFAHELTSGFILCKGNDSHLAIEKINDFLKSNASGLSMQNNQECSNTDCEDISLHENCFEKEQTLPKTRVNLSDGNLNIVFILSMSFYDLDYKFTSTTINKSTKSILENRTTVSLII